MGTKSANRLHHLPVSEAGVLGYAYSKLISISRKRRIKCDETRPVCKRCTISGHTCGYQEQRTSPSDNPAAVMLLTLDPQAAPFMKAASARERRAFHAFRTTVAPSMANSNDEIFWTHDIPRASQVSPAIWHVVLSVTTLRLKEPTPDETSSHSRTTNDSEVFSLTHYGKAISQLVKIMDQPDIPFFDQEVLLIASLVCLEMSMLRGETKEIFIHAFHAIQLFRSWKSWQMNHQSFIRHKDCLLTKPTLLTMMKVLEASFLWTGATKHAPTEVDLNRKDAKPFPSVIAAFEELEPLMSGLTTLYQGGFLYRTYLEQPNMEPDGRIYYRQEIDAWERRYSNTKYPQDFTSIEAALDLVIEVWLLTMDVTLQVSPHHLEDEWDDLTESFRNIVSRTEVIVQNDTTSDDSVRSDTQGPVRTYITALSQALYQVALLCRDHAVRRRAISAMRRLPGYPSDMLLRASIAMAEGRMNAEEQRGIASDDAECRCVDGVYICNNHRAALYKVQFLGEGKISLLLWSRKGYLRGDAPYTAEVRW